jgi:hypothetical protein
LDDDWSGSVPGRLCALDSVCYEKRQVEQAVMSAAGDIAAFYAVRAISADAKGFQHAINSAGKGDPRPDAVWPGIAGDTADQNLPAAMSARVTLVTT